MLELKAFVQESVHALDDDALRVLCDTLRVDARGCDDRRDIERILTGLLCLDKDTTLGTFLTWLRTRETQAQTNGLLARKTAFRNTFVPTISPHKPSSSNQELVVKEHHLNDIIATQLDELTLLEHDFKDAERQVHHGAPSFEKLKAFLVKLTKLRTKEQDLRHYFIQQSDLLTQQHTQMKEETLHTRAQLDFFVDGFTNLRHRHDELVEKSTQMKAENEIAQDVFLSLAAQESHFGAILHRTMLHMLDEKRILLQEVDNARHDIDSLRHKQKQLEELVSRLKHERGNALKDANSYKLQLRKCKQKMETLATDGPDCAYFRHQAIQLRGSLMTLLMLFRDSIVRDTKSPKQTLSKEIVRTVQRVLLAPPAFPTNSTIRPLRGMTAVTDKEPDFVARVVEKKTLTNQDVDEVVRGVVLLGGREGEAAECALMLCTKVRYIPIDLKSLLDQLRDETLQANQRAVQAAASLVDEATGVSEAIAVPTPIVIPPPSPTVENYLIPLKAALMQLQNERRAKGIVLYNYELTAREANLLIGSGFPIDSILDLQLPPLSIPPPTPVQPSPPTASPKSISKGSTSPSRGAATRPASKATPSSSSRPSSRQATADPKKPTTSTAATGSLPTTHAKVKAVDRKAVFAGFPQVFAQLPPTIFVDDRVTLILEELTRQKNARATPFVTWDNATNQVNESLLMYAEDVHMMIWIEQDNRKPKKPETITKPTTPAASKTGNSSPVRAGPGSTSKTPVKAAAKTKASPTRSPSKPGSPTRPGTNAKAISPAKPVPSKTVLPIQPKATGTTASPKKSSTISPSPEKPPSAVSPKRKA